MTSWVLGRKLPEKRERQKKNKKKIKRKERKKEENRKRNKLAGVCQRRFISYATAHVFNYLVVFFFFFHLRGKKRLDYHAWGENLDDGQDLRGLTSSTSNVTRRIFKKISTQARWSVCTRRLTHSKRGAWALIFLFSSFLTFYVKWIFLFSFLTREKTFFNCRDEVFRNENWNLIVNTRGF